MSKPVDRKVYAGSTASGGVGFVAILLTHYFDMPADVASAWTAIVMWIGNLVAGYLARTD